MFQRASSRPKRRAPVDKQEAVRARSGGILCLPLSSYGKATTRFLDSRRKTSLARNDVHLLGYSISGTETSFAKGVVVEAACSPRLHSTVCQTSDDGPNNFFGLAGTSNRDGNDARFDGRIVIASHE